MFRPGLCVFHFELLGFTNVANGTRMFGLSEINVELPKSIKLVTRHGNPISNAQGGKVAHGRVVAFREMCIKKRWEFRCDPEGTYNCAGHVWASRRTGISESEDWRRILIDDGYRRLPGPHKVLPEDLVLYRDVDDDTYLHVARVVRLVAGVSETVPPIPIVLSKWGHDLGECLHSVYDHGISEYNLEIEFWTDRVNDDTIPPTARSLILL